MLHLKSAENKKENTKCYHDVQILKIFSLLKQSQLRNPEITIFCKNKFWNHTVTVLQLHYVLEQALRHKHIYVALKGCSKEKLTRLRNRVEF